MDYQKSLTIRIIIALIVFIIPYKFINFILLKLTLYGSYPLLLLNYNPLMINNSFVINNYILKMISACVATSAYYLLFILIISTKDIKLKDSIKLFLIGSFLILLANIVRIDILIYIFLEFGKNLFEKIHIIFWQFLSSIYVALVWIFLIRKLLLRILKEKGGGFLRLRILRRVRLSKLRLLLLCAICS